MASSATLRPGWRCRSYFTEEETSLEWSWEWVAKQRSPGSCMAERGCSRPCVAWCSPQLRPPPGTPPWDQGAGPGRGGRSTAAGLLWVLSVCFCLAWVLWGALGEKRGNTVFFFYLDSACLPRADKTLRVSLCLDPGQWDVRGSSPGAAAVDVSSPGTSVIKLNQ